MMSSNDTAGSDKDNESSAQAQDTAKPGEAQIEMAREDASAPATSAPQPDQSSPKTSLSRAQAPAWLRALRIVAIVVLVAAAAVAGGFVSRFVAPKLSPELGTEAARISDLSEKVDALSNALEQAHLKDFDARLSALEQASPGAGGDFSQLSSRLDAAEQSVIQLSATVKELQEKPALTLPNGLDISEQTLANFNAAAGDLKSSIADLGKRLDAMSAELHAANASLAQRVASLEQQVPANLAEQLGDFVHKSDLKLLDQRIAALESNTAALDAKRAAAAIALANLVRAASSGDPFANELEAVKLLNVDKATLAPIAAYASQGVPSTSSLAASFDKVAREAVRASRTGGDWWSRLWANISNLFLVRRQGPAKGSSVDATVARAEAAAKAGNLQSAVAELGALKGAPAKAVATWKEQAKARIDLNRLTSKLSSELIASLEGPSTAP